MLERHPSKPSIYGHHLRRRRQALEWTQKETATLLGISCDILSDWERGLVEPRLSRIPKIEKFLGYQVENERAEIPDLIESICQQTGLSCYKLAPQIGISSDTLFNLKSNRYPATRRTAQAIQSFAKKLNLR
ncbi:MAG: helix-turn-helix domain-containing protein [Roseibacillus sp.]